MSVQVVRKARVVHLCDSTSPLCTGRIEPGEHYRRTTVFPLDGLLGEAPVALIECPRCLDAAFTYTDDQARRDEQDTLDAMTEGAP